MESRYIEDCSEEQLTLDSDLVSTELLRRSEPRKTRSSAFYTNPTLTDNKWFLSLKSPNQPAMPPRASIVLLYMYFIYTNLKSINAHRSIRTSRHIYTRWPYFYQFASICISLATKITSSCGHHHPPGDESPIPVGYLPNDCTCILLIVDHGSGFSELLLSE